ncbi:MAG: hypothetical protein ACYSUS_09765, partial [Planctomycetota bacterium]
RCYASVPFFIMQKLAMTIRFVLFGIFFLAGAGAIVLSILADPELKDYYQSRAALAQIKQQNEKIVSLTRQYETLIGRIEAEPNILDRLIPLTFGHKPQAADTAFPRVQNHALQTETEKLLEQIDNTPHAEPIPAWFARILEPKIRRGLFLSGAGLVLITCIFFGTTKGKLITLET